MKVILQQDIPKVGKDGEIVQVANGYARNFLFPRKYAVSATSALVKEHQARMDRESTKTATQLKAAQQDASKIDGKTITIIAKVGSNSKLYGSITSQDIVDRIQAEFGVAADKRRVALVDPIKVLGDYNIAIRLHTDVTVTLTVSVTTEEELAKKVAAEAIAAEAAAKAKADAPAEAPVVTASSEEAAPSE